MVERNLKPYDEAVAARVAAIMGPSSAAAKAIETLYARRAVGESVSLYLEGTAVLVGPTMPPPED